MIKGVLRGYPHEAFGVPKDASAKKAGGLFGAGIFGGSATTAPNFRAAEPRS
jgi:hypothetical protein